MAERIVIVEDEPDLVSILEYSLTKEGFEVAFAHTGAEGLRMVQASPPNLLLLDVMLPDMSGIEICRRLRSTPAGKELPIIMMTARGEEVDRVVGFEVGADDYVVKPLSVRELILRVRAVLRRRSTQPAEPELVKFGRLRIDQAGHRVWVDDNEVVFTALEFRLLTTLVQRCGRVQTRDTLLHDVWGVAPGLTTRTVDTHVRRLRKKLGQAAPYVQTLRGVGYRFNSDVPEGAVEGEAL